MLYNHSRDDQGNVTLTVNQTGYIETLITRFGLDGDEHKPVDTPMIEHSNEEDLEKKLNKTSPLRQTVYRGSLLCAATRSEKWLAQDR